MYAKKRYIFGMNDARLFVRLPRKLKRDVAAYAKKHDASVGGVVKAALICFISGAVQWTKTDNGGSQKFLYFTAEPMVSMRDATVKQRKPRRKGAA